MGNKCPILPSLLGHLFSKGTCPRILWGQQTSLREPEIRTLDHLITRSEVWGQAEADSIHSSKFERPRPATKKQPREGKNPSHLLSSDHTNTDSKEKERDAEDRVNMNISGPMPRNSSLGEHQRLPFSRSCHSEGKMYTLWASLKTGSEDSWCGEGLVLPIKNLENSGGSQHCWQISLAGVKGWG